MVTQRRYNWRRAVRDAGGTSAGIHALNAAIRRIPHKPCSPVMTHLKANPSISLVISPERRFVYIKIAKTAGTSILHGILLREIGDIITRRETPLRYLRWLRGTTDKKLAEYYVFTIVRNPFDRLASAYRHLGATRSMSFHRFIELVVSGRGGIAIHAHTLPQNIHIQVGGVRFANFVGRFENLASDWTAISRVIRVPSRLPRINVGMPLSSCCRASSLYSDEAVRRVREYYRLDFELLGYDAESPVTRSGGDVGEKGGASKLALNAT